MRAPEQAEELRQLEKLLGAGRYSKAEALAAELTGQHPDYASGWKALGLSLFMQGKDALLALQHAARLLSEEAGAQHDLGVALQQSGQPARAAESYRRALALAYVARVVAHAADLQHLSALRQGLRAQVLALPLFDAPRFALHFEAALRGMWAAWCARQSAQLRR